MSARVCRTKKTGSAINCGKRTETLIARLRLLTVGNSNVPASAKITINIVDAVLTYKDAPICKRVGSFRAIDIDGNYVMLLNHGRTVRFSIIRCKHYRGVQD